MGIRAKLALLVSLVVGASILALVLVTAEQDRQERLAFVRSRNLQFLKAIGVNVATGS